MGWENRKKERETNNGERLSEHSVTHTRQSTVCSVTERQVNSLNHFKKYYANTAALSGPASSIHTC